jgi:5-methylcytosine-specific restriction enzyme subunit McrC
VGELILIYPKTLSFSSPLLPFDFSPNLRLWVVPIDLVKDEVHWPAQWNMELTDYMAMSG